MKLVLWAIVVLAAVLPASAQLTGPCAHQPVPQEFGTFCRTLEANPKSSLAHFRIAELFFLNNNLQSAANEFRDALNGDLDPKWIDVWAHMGLGRIFVRTEQRNRAVNEYKQALLTGDNTDGAQDEAVRLLKDLARTEPVATLPADYTDEARIAELEGAVLLEGDIGEDRLAHDLILLQPLGLGLDEKAFDAVRTQSFTPVQTNGQYASARSTIAVDFILSSKQSRWHLVSVTFDVPANAARPKFLSTVYPPGAGIALSPEIVERGALLSAIGRPATAKLDFDVNEAGRPTNIRVQSASDPMWGNQATAFVSEWRFQAGTKDGMPISVACSVDLMWGPQTMTASMADLVRNTSTRQAAQQR